MRYVPAACAASVLLLSACSSGGGGNAASTSTPNPTQPTAATSASASTSSAAAASPSPSGTSMAPVAPAFTGSTIKVSDLNTSKMAKSTVVFLNGGDGRRDAYNRDLDAICTTVFGKPNDVAAEAGHPITSIMLGTMHLPIVVGNNNWLGTYSTVMLQKPGSMSWIGTPGPSRPTTGNSILCGYSDEVPLNQDRDDKGTTTSAANEFAIMPGTVAASAVPGYIAGKNNVMVKPVAGVTLVAESFTQPLSPATSGILDKAASHLS